MDETFAKILKKGYSININSLNKKIKREYA